MSKRPDLASVPDHIHVVVWREPSVVLGVEGVFERSQVIRRASCSQCGWSGRYWDGDPIPPCPNCDPKPGA